MKDFDELSFNIFEVQKYLNDENILSIMTLNALKEMNLIGQRKQECLKVDEKSLNNFLNKVAISYNNDIPYHNQMHGADVMHMSYLMMTKFGLAQTLHMK